jgi:cell wall-associated NlpC family hydrolase
MHVVFPDGDSRRLTARATSRIAAGLLAVAIAFSAQPALATDEVQPSASPIVAAKKKGKSNPAGVSSSPAAQPAAESAPDSTADVLAPTFGFTVANTDGDGLRLREAPGLASTIVARLPEGTPIMAADGKSVDKDGETWVAVRLGQSVAWAASRYLSKFTLPQSDTKQLASDASFGERVVRLALSAVGRPYVFGAAGPSAFDCSGFAQWVYTQAGRSLERTIPQQLAAGTPVAVNALKPGDLLAYVRTYTPGLSHVGIYVGNNQMIHAADESQGVRISNTQDPYWSSRFYMAVRLR